MRASKYTICTLREAPAEAEIASHKLMIRAGMIRKLASGLYTWLPTGIRVLNKVEAIVRREMDKSGALECRGTALIPADLWIATERYNAYGDNLMKLKDRKQADLVLGPTHEETFTDLARTELFSYRQLPVNLYQIQTKFRDETRPRYGILRTREFLMKDAYSFHVDRASLQETYDVMYQTYCNVFDACGLKYRAVEADNGSIGGTGSMEFQVLAEAGEDTISFCPNSKYAANIEKAPAIPNFTRQAPTQEVAKLHTPNVKSIEEVCNFLNVPAEKTLKLIVVQGSTEEHPIVALALRGDHEINEIKAEKHPLIASPITLANPEQVNAAFGANVGSLGVVNCPIYLIADDTAAQVSDFVTGANADDYHLTGVNWDRDAKFNETYDLRNVVAGDPSPCGQGTLELARGIECGHIFQLGTKYSEKLKAQVTNEKGELIDLVMGCYGIGVSRVVAAAVEQNHDEYGILWPDQLAPFKVAIVGINPAKSQAVVEQCEALYQKCLDLGIEVFYDDRGERLGVALADLDLMGIPYQIIIGEKNLDQNGVEFKVRRDNSKAFMSFADLETKLTELAK